MPDARSAARYAAEDAIREISLGRLDAARNALIRSLQRLDAAIEEESDSTPDEGWESLSMDDPPGTTRLAIIRERLGG